MVSLSGRDKLRKQNKKKTEDVAHKLF